MAVAIAQGALDARRAWLVWLLGALSFGYAFLQRVSLSVMVGDLMRDFAVGAAVLGNLSALYFYVYAALQVPVGLAHDRFGPRRVLTAALLVAAIGSALFASAQSLEAAYLGRFLVGAGCAASFVGALKLAAAWFPPGRFAFLSGMTMLIAMLGGVAGQAPMAAIVEAHGWRATLLGAALLGLGLAAATWTVVRDRPGEAGVVARPAARGGFVRALRGPQNWLLALFAGAMSGPLLAYGGLWAVPHLMQTYGLERPAAAGAASLMLIGFAVGAPLGGWLSDFMGRRKLPLVAAAALALAGWLLLLYGPPTPLAGTMALLAFIGAVSGPMVVCMAAAREQSPAAIGGAVTGFINTAMVGGAAVMQPLVGVLLDARWDGASADGARLYSADAYAGAFVALPASVLLALLAAALAKETFGRPQAP